MNIMRERKALGMSRRELANRLGVTAESVRNWERGKTVPRERSLRGLKTLVMGKMLESKTSPGIAESEIAVLVGIAITGEADDIESLEAMIGGGFAVQRDDGYRLTERGAYMVAQTLRPGTLHPSLENVARCARDVAWMRAAELAGVALAD